MRQNIYDNLERSRCQLSFVNLLSNYLFICYLLFYCYISRVVRQKGNQINTHFDKVKILNFVIGPSNTRQLLLRGYMQKYKILLAQDIKDFSMSYDQHGVFYVLQRFLCYFLELALIVTTYVKRGANQRQT